jgi:hypothetical protein
MFSITDDNHPLLLCLTPAVPSSSKAYANPTKTSNPAKLKSLNEHLLLQKNQNQTINDTTPKRNCANPAASVSRSPQTPSYYLHKIRPVPKIDSKKSRGKQSSTILTSPENIDKRIQAAEEKA